MPRQLRGALREQHRQTLGPVDQRHQHRRGHRVRRKVPRQALAALGVDTEHPPVGQFMTRLRSREAPQDAGAQIRRARPRSTRASAAVHAAARQRGRIEQAAQLGLRESRHLERHVEHRPPFRIGALGDRGGLFVADDRIERGGEDRIARQRIVEARGIGLERRRRIASPSARAPFASRWMAVSRLLAMSGSMTLSWKLPDCPAMAMVASRPMTCAAIIATASGITGLTLPGMMLLPGCSAGNLSSASPASGPEPIQRRSFAIFIERHRERAQLAGKFDRRILRRLGGEQVRGGRERHGGQRAQLLDETRREFGMRIDAGADGRATLRQRQQPRFAGAQPFDAPARSARASPKPPVPASSASHP